MTGETGKESTSKEVTSLMPKLLSNPPTPGKVIPIDSSVLPQTPPFLSSHQVLSMELLSDIDKKWDACWPINMLRPLVLLDLISYLLFIKKLEERRLTDNLIHTNEREKLSWSRFKDMDAQSMHQLFTEENGIPDIMKEYGHSRFQYSLFLKEPLLLAPTAKLLANMVDIIKIMEAQDSNTRAAIFEYLLNKAEIVAQNGQVYAPDYIVKLMVALMQPTPEDLIGDPSVGNGCLLVNSAMYIANKNSEPASNFKDNPVADIYKGIESDLIQLRIGAMNMILHGIEDPKIEGINIFSGANLSLREKPTLILSNLFFEGIEDKTTVKANTSQTETRRKEICFLNLILKSLKKGGRAAVIIRDIILYDNITEIKTIRQQIIDDHKLDAVISLPVTSGSLFSGACILIFTKPESGTTDKVWFYKMDGKDGINKKEANAKVYAGNDVLAFTGEFADVPDILARWKNEEETRRERTDKSFYVSVGDIRINNYNLGFNDYRTIGKEAEIPAPHEPLVPEKGDAPGTTTQIRPPSIPVKENVTDNKIQRPAVPVVEKRKLPEEAPAKRKFSPVFVSLVVVCLAGLAIYFIYFRDNNDKAVSITAQNNISPAKIKAEQPADKPVSKTPASTMLSREQIKAILKDTTGILHFQEQPNDLSASTKTAAKRLAKYGNAKTLVDKKPEKVPDPVTSENVLKVQYTVTDTTFFHDAPDENTRRNSYLDPLNKNILNPIQDRNGFIYVVYTNRFGRTSKGWINKKDLKPLR